MSDTTYQTFQHYGTNAERLAFTPAPAAGIQPIYIWYETDTGDTYIYDTSWHLVTSGGSGSINVSAGTTSNNLTNIVFSNSNSISFGLNGSTITATVSYPTQTNQTVGLYALSQTTGESSSSTRDARSLSFRGAGLVSVGLSAGEYIISATAAAGGGITNINLSAGTTSNNLSAFVLSNSNNVSFGLNGSTVTASATVASTQGSVRISAGTTSVLSSGFTFSNSNNVSFGIDNGTITGTVTVASTQGSIRISAGTTSILSSGFTFSDSNGLAFGMNNGTVTGSYTVPTVTNSSWTASDNATSLTIARLAFTNANGLTLTLSTTTGGSATLIGSYTVPTVTNSSWTVSDNATSGTVARLAFTNLNGLTLSLSTGAGGSHTIVGSHNGITSQTNQTLSFVATSNTTQNSTTTLDARSITIQGAGIASVGFSNGSIVISVPSGGGAGDGGVFAGVSNLGNTSGSTGTVSTGNFVLVGSNGITLNQSTGAAGSAATVTIVGPTIYTHSGFDPFGVGGEYVVGQVGQAQPFIFPFSAPNFQFDNVQIPILNTNSSNSSGSHTLSFWLGVFTRNASTLSRLISTSFSTAVTHSGTAGSYSLYSGVRDISFGWTNTLIESDYWMYFVSRTTSGGTGGTYSNVQISNWNTGFSGFFGQALNNSNQMRFGQGLYSVTSSGVPVSIGFSELSGTGSAVLRPQVIHFLSQTV